MEKIDVHAHFVPPSWRKLCEETGHANPDGMPAIPPWTEEGHVDLMDRQNISKSILSISSPGAYLVENFDSLARQTAKECNDFAADLKKRRPDRFGFWAILPLPDVDGSLDELERALGELDADGIGLETNAHGRYLGDPEFDRIFDALDRKKATVFIHPTAPCIHNCFESLPRLPSAPLPQYPLPAFEFFFDTARAITNLFVSGTIERCPNITYIVPHLGGALPPLLPRVFNILKMVEIPSPEFDDVKRQISDQFFFDLAGFSLPDQLHGLLPFVTSSQLLYGSDYPYTKEPVVEQEAQRIRDELPKFFPDEDEQRAIYHGNAAKLLARQLVITDGSHTANEQKGSRDSKL